MLRLCPNESLVLASSSPRRRELLGACGIEFKIVVSDVDETPLPLEEGGAMVARLSLAKASAVAKKHSTAWVLGADTTVVLGREILGKPSDADEARRMLKKIQSNTHTVWSAFSLVNESKRVNETVVQRSDVELVPLSDAAIDAYVATGEPLDKAGAYGIQELGAHLVARISGSYTNVVGLDIAAVVQTLLRFEVIEYVAVRS